MSHEKIFRTLLLAYVIVGVAAGIATIALESTLPALLLTYLETRTGQEYFAAQSVVFLAFFLVFIVNLIGLWRFKTWAKTLYVVFTAISFLTLPLMGPVVMNAWEGLLYDLSILLGGIILALLYTGPVAAKFRKTPAPQQV